MALDNYNRTNKIQYCVTGKYGRIERKPGKHWFYVIMPSELKTRTTNREFQAVMQEVVPDAWIRRRVESRKKMYRCAECSGLFVRSEMADGLCRGCYCGEGTLEEELQRLRHTFKHSDVWQRDISVFDDM